jgi:glycosyltransferase involved in cell wall biosynthesis
MKTRILHLGTETSWRGGENQARLLIEGLDGKVDKQFGAVPIESVTYREKRWPCELLGLGSGSPLSPFNVYKLIRFCRDQQISLVDAHTAKAHSLILQAAPWLPSTRIVVHRRVDNVPKSSFFTRRKYFHPRVNRYIAISNSIAEVLLRYGVGPKKVSVARSAVSHSIYESLERSQCQATLKSRYQIPSHHRLIGNASALSPQKGHETLLRAIATLKRKQDHFTVLIAGDGELKSELEKMSRALGVSDRVLFLGFVQNVPEFLSALDILAVPSNNEGLGTVILDGILAGCAVVASRVGGIPEIIVHEETGFLQEVGDDQKLADHLLALIQNPDLRQRLSQSAKAWVLKEFSLDSMVKGNLRVYREVLGIN